jgi:hypothetical protein
MEAALLVAAKGLGEGLLIQAGGAAGLIAIIAMVLVVPLYVTQRREVKRLERWRELEPERGDEGAPQVAAAGTATAAPGTAGFPAQATPAGGQPAAPRPTGGFMTPAERVTADRPALSRITAERAAIQSPSFWRRLLARGPRHPLVLSLIAILVAGALVAGVYFASDNLNNDDPSKGGGGFDRSATSLVVINGSGTAGLADRVADDVAAAGFSDVRTGATGSTPQTVVYFDKGNKREANAVAKELGVDILQPIDRDTKALAPDADVVVIAGEDRARA